MEDAGRFLTLNSQKRVDLIRCLEAKEFFKEWRERGNY